MIKASVIAVASIGFFATGGLALACEMHGKDHTSLQTAATQPIVTPPLIKPSPKPEPVALQAAPAEVKAMSTSEGFGGIGCPRMRKQQTVYYTN